MAQISDLQVSTAQTTDGTPTGVATVTLPDASASLIEAKMLGRNTSTGDIVVFNYNVSAKRHSGGGAALVGGPVTVSSFSSASLTLCGIVAEASGNTVVIGVTGLVATTIEWMCVCIVNTYTI